MRLFLLLFFCLSAAAVEPLELLPKYVGEEKGIHLGDEWIHPEYWDKEMQKEHEYRHGCLGAVLQMDGHYMYVILTTGQMILGKFDFGRVHHSSLAAGQPVLSAGWVKLKKGKVVFIDSNSGHYRPKSEHLKYARKWLKARDLVHDDAIAFEWVDTGMMALQR